MGVWGVLFVVNSHEIFLVSTHGARASDVDSNSILLRS